MHLLFLLCLLFALPLYGATHFFLVRHGETDRNTWGTQLQGWIDDDAAQLNEKGKTQADTLGKLLAERYPNTISIIYSSPLGRCMETSTRIAQSFSPALPIVKEGRLIEICHGQYDLTAPKERTAYSLQRYAELQNQFPELAQDRFFKWKINPLAEKDIPPERIEKPFPGNLETIFQVYERATSALADIAQKHPNQTVLISSHWGVIRMLTDEAVSRTKGDTSVMPAYFEPTTPHSIPNNCSLYHFVWENGQLTFLQTEN